MSRRRSGSVNKPLLFEVSSEVCNASGGIATVIGMSWLRARARVCVCVCVWWVWYSQYEWFRWDDGIGVNSPSLADTAIARHAESKAHSTGTTTVAAVAEEVGDGVEEEEEDDHDLVSSVRACVRVCLVNFLPVSRLLIVVEAWGDRYCLLGIYVEASAAGEFEPLEAGDMLASVIEALRNDVRIPLSCLCVCACVRACLCASVRACTR